MTNAFEVRTRLNRQMIERLEERTPEAPEGLWRLASLQRQVGDLDAARRTLESIPLDQRSAAAQRLLQVLRREPLADGGGQVGFQPAPFALFDDVLTPAECSLLRECARQRRADFAPGKVYTPDHQNAPVVAEKARSSLVLSSPNDIAQWLLPRVRQCVSESLPVLGLRPFELFDTEIHVSASGNGDRLKSHQDVRPAPAPQRRVSYVLYFGTGAERLFEGGDFLLYDTDLSADRWDPASYTRIEPLHNRLLLFGGSTYHEVAEVRCDPEVWEARRFAVCGWFREAVAGHSDVT